MDARIFALKKEKKKKKKKKPFYNKVVGNFFAQKLNHGR
jgi:hypothetical protein